MISGIGSGASLPIAESRQQPRTAAGDSAVEIDPVEQAVVEDLSRTDREVRAHEQAHLIAAGSYATSGPSFEYRKGPDGKSYAVAGEVSIDTSPVQGDPEATIRKARTIQSAALAPANPSGQDRAVAVGAAQLEQQARAELAALEKIYNSPQIGSGASVNLLA